MPNDERPTGVPSSKTIKLAGAEALKVKAAASRGGWEGRTYDISGEVPGELKEGETIMIFTQPFP